MRFGPRSVFCQDPKAILDALKLERDLVEKVQTVVTHQKRRLTLEKHVLEHLVQELGEGTKLPSSISLSQSLKSHGLDVEQTPASNTLPCFDKWLADGGDVVEDMCGQSLSDVDLPKGITGQFPDTVRRRRPSSGEDSEGSEEEDESVPQRASSHHMKTKEVTETRDRTKRQRVMPEEEQYPILYGIRAKRQA